MGEWVGGGGGHACVLGTNFYMQLTGKTDHNN